MHGTTPTVTRDDERLAYGLDEVAGKLGITRRHVYRLIERGEMRRVKVGKRAMVLAEDLEAYVTSLKAGAAA